MQQHKADQASEPIQLNAIRRTSLADDIMEQLISYIVSQKLKPGDKLPSERILSEHLKVSRFPLREALSRLQALGIISVAHGKGAFVSEFNVQDLLRRFSPILESQTGISVTNIVEVRLALECSIVKLAAHRRGAETVEKLERELARMKQELNNRDAFVESDIKFHETLANATANPIFEDLGAIFHNLMYIAQMKFPDDPEARRRSVGYHEEVLNAIKDKDAERAEKAMRSHLEDIMQRVSEEGVDGKV